MKAFYSTATIFLLTLFLIFYNAVQVKEFTSATEERLYDLKFSTSSSCIDEVERLKIETQTKIRRIEFSISHDKRTQLFQSLDLLAVAAKLQNKTEFEIARSNSINALAEISALEKINLFGIL